MSHDESRPAAPSDHLSAVKPGGVDCTTVLADVFLYIDDEGDVDARNRIREHLDDCAPCLRHYGVERDVKALVARSCGGDRAPDSLRSSIRVSLSSVTFDDGSTVETSTVEYRQGR